MLEYRIIYILLVIGIFLTLLNQKSTFVLGKTKRTLQSYLKSGKMALFHRVLQRSVKGYNKYVQSQYLLYYIFVCFIMIIICGMRDESIGLDTANYLDFFLDPDGRGYYQTEILNTIEPGFRLLNAVLRLFIWNGYGYQLVIAAISFIPIFVFYKNYSKNKFLSLFLFASMSVGMSIYVLGFSAMRQVLAIGMEAIFLSYYIKSNRNFYDKRCLLSFLCMFLIHYSSLMVALLILFDRVHLTKLRMYIIIGAAIAIGYFINRFGDSLRLISMMITGSDFYLTDSEKPFSIVSLMPYVLIAVALIYFYNEKKLNELGIKSYLLTVVIIGTMSFIGNNVDRMCAYFLMPAFVSIPNFMMDTKRKLLLCVPIWIAIIGYFTYKYFLTLHAATDGGHNFVPYIWCI